MCELIEVTEQDIRYEAESLAQEELGVSAAEAWRRVRAGEFQGTVLAAELHQANFLLGGRLFQNHNQA